MTFMGTARSRSSPRERGSSVVHDRTHDGIAVVPARAGVIRDQTGLLQRHRRRPRASGGHPSALIAAAAFAWSSPRERGSSAVRLADVLRSVVVPARAGVIHEFLDPAQWLDSRPRASGGHPPSWPSPESRRWSSPRERGSSADPAIPAKLDEVVPARAGVIRSPGRRGQAESSRPRASGGHPKSLRRTQDENASSPRERGSSGEYRWPYSALGVVPARAGVIRLPSLPPHPRLRSSPRERGSSVVGGLR